MPSNFSMWKFPLHPSTSFQPPLELASSAVFRCHLWVQVFHGFDQCNDPHHLYQKGCRFAKKKARLLEHWCKLQMAYGMVMPCLHQLQLQHLYVKFIIETYWKLLGRYWKKTVEKILKVCPACPIQWFNAAKPGIDDALLELACSGSGGWGLAASAGSAASGSVASTGSAGSVGSSCFIFNKKRLLGKTTRLLSLINSKGTALSFTVFVHWLLTAWFSAKRLSWDSSCRYHTNGIFGSAHSASFSRRSRPAWRIAGCDITKVTIRFGESASVEVWVMCKVSGAQPMTICNCLWSSRFTSSGQPRFGGFNDIIPPAASTAQSYQGITGVDWVEHFGERLTVWQVPLFC